MEIALIVGFSLLLTIGLLGGVMIYSHYQYSKNRLFSKTKYAVTWIILCGTLSVLLLIGGIFFTLDLKSATPIAYCPVFVGLSFSCLALSLFYFVFFLLIPTLTNKNKIAYDQILKIDYEEKLDKLLQKIGDIEKVKDCLAKKNKRYYQDMIIYYENMLNRAKDEKISFVNKLADIITFNDAFTHKWCSNMNNYHLFLTYKFCIILQKIS